MVQQELHIHLVSDSTGETVHQIARACLAQFPAVTATEHVWTLVRSERHLDAVFSGVERSPGILLMSIVDSNLRQQFEERCTKANVPYASVLDPVVSLLGEVLGLASQNLPGRQRKLDKAYFNRIAAVDFAVSHDDGLNMGNLANADILLVGVSRTSKTPTSMYLAHRGYRVANYALVPGVEFPIHHLDGLDILVIGLTNDPKRLSQVRRTRQIAMADEQNLNYSDQDAIEDEVRQARRLFTKHKWPVIDVTRRSVEETAAAIIHLKTSRQESQDQESQDQGSKDGDSQDRANQDRANQDRESKE